MMAGVGSCCVMTSRVTVRVVDGQESDRVSQTIVVIPPSADHDLGLLRATKDLELQALVPDSCSEMAVSLQASARHLPCADCTSIRHSLAIVCSALNLFCSILGFLASGQVSQST